MKNKEERKQEIVDCGVIDGVRYWIVENGLFNPYIQEWGIWYCAYIEPTHKMEDKGYENCDTNPHGGVTYCGKLPLIEDAPIVWGWDYNHCDDVTWNNHNFLETRLQVLGVEKAIETIRLDVENYIGGLLDETSY